LINLIEVDKHSLKNDTWCISKEEPDMALRLFSQ